MAWSEIACIRNHRPTPEDLKQRMNELCALVRQLKEQEPFGPSREWLEEAERRHQEFKTSLENYSRNRAEQCANESAGELAVRNVQASYQTLEDYTKTGAHHVAEGFRKSWDELTSYFNRAFGGDNFGRDNENTEQEAGPRATVAPEEAKEERHKRNGEG